MRERHAFLEAGRSRRVLQTSADVVGALPARVERSRFVSGATADGSMSCGGKRSRPTVRDDRAHRASALSTTIATGRTCSTIRRKDSPCLRASIRGEGGASIVGTEATPQRADERGVELEARVRRADADDFSSRG